MTNELAKQLNSCMNKQFEAITKYELELRHKFEFDPFFPDSTSEFINLLTNSINSSNNIFFIGVGKNDTIAKKSSNMLRSLNFSSHYLSPVDAMHGDMGMLRKDDILIAISKSGNTHELIHFLQYVSSTFKSNIKIVGIQIGENVSKFHEVCDIIIKLPQIDEIDSLNIVPTMSNIVTQLYIDMISIVIAEQRGLTLDSFTLSHPGGDIGKQFKR